MKIVTILLFTIILYGCDSQPTSNKDISKDVANNNSWPMEVEGTFEWGHSNDHGGIDQNVFGSINSSSDSYIMVDTLDSILKKGGVSNGDYVVAKIKPSDIDGEYYTIISISKK